MIDCTEKLDGALTGRAPAAMKIEALTSVRSAVLPPLGVENFAVQVEAAFQQAAGHLDSAADDDDPGYSGESTRLLRQAAAVARSSQAHMPDAVADRAWDVAALVRAARMVPGDADSAGRMLHIHSANAHLAFILGRGMDEDLTEPYGMRPEVRHDLRRPATPSLAASARNSVQQAARYAAQATCVILAAADDDKTDATNGVVALVDIGHDHIAAYRWPLTMMNVEMASQRFGQAADLLEILAARRDGHLLHAARTLVALAHAELEDVAAADLEALASAAPAGGTGR